MPSITLVPNPAESSARAQPDEPSRVVRITRWSDPVADRHGVHPCSRYVELYWLGIIGPSATWLLRRLSYGLEVHDDGFDLHLAECARSLGLGTRLGKNAPFSRALQRLCVFDLARGAGPEGLAVRTVIPPLPLRHVQRLPASLQRSHHRWMDERRLSGPEQIRRRAGRLAAELSAAGKDTTEIERRLTVWQFHPAVAYGAARAAANRPADGPDEGQRRTTSGAEAAFESGKPSSVAE